MVEFNGSQINITKDNWLTLILTYGFVSFSYFPLKTPLGVATGAKECDNLSHSSEKGT